MKKRIVSLIVTAVMLVALLPVLPVGAYDMCKVGECQTISAGGNYTAVIKEDGSLWTWGENFWGQLGNGTTIDNNIPNKIMNNVISVSAGQWYTAIIKEDKTLWTFGYNGYGQLGDGTTTNKYTPTKILDDVVAVSAGYVHTAAIKSDGSLWTWGHNNGGQLGDGTTTDKHKPTKILDDVVAVSVGGDRTFAIKSDGSLWAWGYNNKGQLGDGTTVDKYKPTKILEDVIAVSSSGSHTAIIKNDNSLWTWGNNFWGQLGDGTNTNTNKPTKILDDVIAVSVASDSTAIINKDHSLCAWGFNRGQLGDSSITYQEEPIKILDDVFSFSAGGGHIAAIKSDQSLWLWGDNSKGQIGDGTTEDKHTPVHIMDNVMLPNSTATTPIIPATPSEWAANDINSAIELGLIPEELQSDWQTPITRFDFCKLAVALYMKVRPNAVLVPTDKFSDISGMSSEDNYKIGTAAGLGIVNGYADGTFRPYNEITRQEAAVMLMNTAQALGLSPMLEQLGAHFVDCENTEDWAMKGIKYVYNQGIMSGTDVRYEDDGLMNGNYYITFEPLSTYTREQAMVTFYRLFGKIQQGVTDASDDEFIPKTPYEIAYNNYLKEVRNYKRAVENALDTDKQEKELKKNMKAAMLEHWIINGIGIKRSEIPDSVYEAMYMFTGSLGDFKILSKNYNWANTKGLLEGCIDMTVTTLSNVGGGKHKYLVDGTYITIDGTTIGKNGTGTISWDGKMATFATNPEETTNTFLSFVEQCTELVADIMNDEFKEVSKMLTGYSTVEDFLKQKLSNKYNNFLKEMGLGDFNETAGNMLAMLNNASNLMMSGSNQEILDNMIKLNNDEYDTSVTNLMVSEAFDDVKTAQTKLIEAAKEKFYDQYGN